MYKTTSDSKKSSTALVYPGNSFLAKPLCQALLRHHSLVVAVAQDFAANLLPLFDREGFTFLYFADFEKKPPAEIDYIFEIGPRGQMLTTAKQFQAKYEALLEKENEKLAKKAKKEKIDFRITIGHQLFGPNMKFEAPDFITQTLNTGVKSETLKIPGNGLQRIYPLFINDFADGAVRAMFAPGTTGHVFEFYGPAITTFSFVHLVKKATKDQSQVRFVKKEEVDKIKKPNLETLKDLKQVLDWQPKQDLGGAVKKTIWEIKEAKTEIISTGKIKEIELVKDGKPPIPPSPPKPFDKDRVEIEEPVVLPVDLDQKQRKIQLVLKQAQKLEPVNPQTQKAFLPAPSLPFPPAHPPSPSSSKSGKTRKACLPAHLPAGQAGRSRRILKIFFFLLIVVTLACFVPFVYAGFQGYQGTLNLKEAKLAVQKGEPKEYNQYLAKAQKNFSKAQNILNKTEPVLEFLKLESAFFVFDSWLSLGNQVTQISILGTQTTQKARLFGQNLLASHPVDIKLFVQQENRLLSELISAMSLLETQLDQEDTIKVDLPFFHPQKQVDQIKKYLPTGKKLAASAKESLSLLPSLLAQDGRRTYLVLFQNNMELRPTGGFIGSFGLLTFEKGRFLDFGVLDVYAADGQLKGHVEPPEKLKEYLGEAGWYLRDSNWDPNFPTAARQAAWFLEKEMGRSVDGVIAINLNFAQKILTALGEVYLPNYQEKINTNNLYQRAEYHSEIGSFAGSTQKADFLGTLSNVIFEEVKAASEGEFFGLAKALYQALEEQDLLIYLNDSKAFKTIQKFSWSGEIFPVTCHMSHVTCFPDYLMLVEANVGVNKANYFINRKIDQKIKIDQKGRVIHTLKITYQNTAQTDAWPGGKYKNYLRVYTPEGSEIQRVGSHGWGVGSEHGKTVFSTLVETPINEEKTIELVWQLPKKLPQQDRASYLFFFQKQPGMINTTNSLFFSFPVEVKPLLISPAGSYSPGSLLFADTLKKSRTYRIEFVR